MREPIPHFTPQQRKVFMFLLHQGEIGATLEDINTHLYGHNILGRRRPGAVFLNRVHSILKNTNSKYSIHTNGRRPAIYHIYYDGRPLSAT